MPRPSLFEHYKLSAKYWLAEKTGKTRQLPTRHQSLATDMQNILAIVIEHNNEYLFLQVKSGQEEVRPILVETDDVMENQLNSLFAYFKQQFDVKPEKARFSPYTFNLAPIKPVKFYLAVVSLPEEAFEKVQRSFKTVPASKVVLNRDSNIFFEALARDFEEVPVF